jgi:kinesin family member 20
MKKKIPAFRLPSSFADDEESTNESRDSIASTLSAKQFDNENVSVYLRLRPTADTSSLYVFEENKVVIPQLSANQAINTEKHYTFTSVLEESQVEIYNKIVRPILSQPFASSGGTFASYGVSNSGKTHTMLGQSSPGFVPRSLTQIYSELGSDVFPYPCVKISASQNLCEPLSDDETFTEVNNVHEFLAHSRKMHRGSKKLIWNSEEIQKEHNFNKQAPLNDRRLFIWLSLVEIYNDKITDLLSTEKGATNRTLKIFSNAGNSYVHGATWLYAADLKTAFEIVNYGLCNVSYASTGVNSHSSRSHTIFTIQIIAEMPNENEYELSSYKFCDLAGAERLKKTGNIGERLKEASGINNSLLVLGRCLEAVIHNQKKSKKQAEAVVPVRDSKLTLLIQSSLLGHEKFIMIVNLYPTADFFDENLNVLKFGSIANQIIVKNAESRKFKRKSTRYSFFHTDVASPKKNSTFNET